ncbi:HIT family protein [Reichenbachiella versicolor]|uniref:HIT family protein n=1 Tax=Reichenbachiella versicolor TaxID=1821036 RepID=UPI000D6DE11A|nr:HIT family protein [Reichenbachiella versicolor]
MASIFTRIINREILAHIIAENEEFICFLDIAPLSKGHCLVIPKKEVDYIFDLDDETLIGLNLFAKKIAIGLKKVVPCQRIGTTVIGTEVPHAHIHLIPMNSMADMNFANPKLSFEQEELASLAKEIGESIKL